MKIINKLKLISFIFIFLHFISLDKYAYSGIILEVVQDQIIKKQDIDYSNGDYIKIGDVIVKVINDGGNKILQNTVKNKKHELSNNNKKTNNSSNKIKTQNNNEINKNVKKTINLGEQERSRVQQMIEEQRKKNQEFIKKVNINKLEEDKD